VASPLVVRAGIQIRSGKKKTKRERAPVHPFIGATVNYRGRRWRSRRWGKKKCFLRLTGEGKKKGRASLTLLSPKKQQGRLKSKVVLTANIQRREMKGRKIRGRCLITAYDRRKTRKTRRSSSAVPFRNRKGKGGKRHSAAIWKHQKKRKRRERNLIRDIREEGLHREEKSKGSSRGLLAEGKKKTAPELDRRVGGWEKKGRRKTTSHLIRISPVKEPKRVKKERTQRLKHLASVFG